MAENYLGPPANPSKGNSDLPNQKVERRSGVSTQAKNMESNGKQYVYGRSFRSMMDQEWRRIADSLADTSVPRPRKRKSTELNTGEMANQLSYSMPQHQLEPNAHGFTVNTSAGHAHGFTTLSSDNSYRPVRLRTEYSAPVSLDNNGQHFSSGIVVAGLSNQFLAGQGPRTDGYLGGNGPFLTSLSEKQQPSSAIASVPYAASIGGCISAMACDGGATFPTANRHASLGASSHGHVLAQNNPQYNSMQPFFPAKESTLCPISMKSTHLELPSNQTYPLNTSALKGFAFHSCSRVPATPNPSLSAMSDLLIPGKLDLTSPALRRLKTSHQFGPSPQLQQYPQPQNHIHSQYYEEGGLFRNVNGLSNNPSHPGGAHSVGYQVRRSGSPSSVGSFAISGESKVMPPAPERLKTSDQFGSSSSRCYFPEDNGLPNLLQYPQSQVQIDSRYKDVGPFINVNGVSTNRSHPSWAQWGDCRVQRSSSASAVNNLSIPCESKSIHAVAQSGANVSGTSENLSRDSSKYNRENIFSPLEAIFATSRNVIMGYSVGEPVGDSRCQDPAAVVSLREVTVAPNMDKINEPPDKGSEPKEAGGVSIIEYFSRDQIKEHLSGLKDSSNKILPSNTKMDIEDKSYDPCELCGVKERLFAVPSTYCSSCCKIIKPDSEYYILEEGEELLDGEAQKVKFCTKRCAGKVRTIKRKHDERTAESWVQCNGCRAWNHQICGLYNEHKDPTKFAEYTCPNCCLKFMDNNPDRKIFVEGRPFSAKDLPQTKLGDHIERRLYLRLKREREDRAKASGKNIHEVPGAEDLVVRVVASSTEKMEVNKHFQDMFRDKKYPSAFPYKSKVIALFQKIEGVDVFIFGMFVQEYGTDCSYPNQRSVYISYLDSIKYFCPDIKSADGKSLRTFVYYEILIGYLEYCKKRGFASCYIWVCPPSKGDDFLFHCHPEFQKNLMKKILLKWYQNMIARATEEDIVVSSTNLVKYYFVRPRGTKFKKTAARLPYFQGDHWPSLMERFFEEANEKAAEKSKLKYKNMSRTGSKGRKSVSDGSSLDIILMQKIEQSMQDKNDFIVLHLLNRCTCCYEVILSGKRWFCNQCDNFQLCERCVDVEEAGGQDKASPVCREKHSLCQETVDYVPSDTEDGDIPIKNKYLEKRSDFLDFCKKNNYQFDTLRRAKYSSMMLLHHLEEVLIEQVAETGCSLCRRDLLSQEGRMCVICLIFRVCDECFKRKDFSHQHESIPTSSVCDPLSKIESKWQGSTCKEDFSGLLVHCANCKPPEGQLCSYPFCTKIKAVFSHAAKCPEGGAVRGCKRCRFAWSLCLNHAKYCEDSNCKVPSCSQMKGKRTMQQMKLYFKNRGTQKTPNSAQMIRLLAFE